MKVNYFWIVFINLEIYCWLLLIWRPHSLNKSFVKPMAGQVPVFAVKDLVLISKSNIFSSLVFGVSGSGIKPWIRCKRISGFLGWGRCIYLPQLT